MNRPHETAPADVTEPPLVRVVCVVYNPGPELDVFVTSLARATTRPYELVLVDNGAPSDRVAALERSGAARIVDPGGNVGYGRGANAGAAGATARWLVVANPDVDWSPGSLDALLDAGERHPEAGSLGPRILQADGTVYPSARALPSLRVGAGHALLSKLWPTNPWTRAYRQGDASRGDAERPVGWLSGACLLLRPEAFRTVGGFDERYFMFFEDVDLGERLVRAGWSNVFVPSATVTHLQGASWKSTPAPMIRAHHASARRYLFDRYPRWYQAPLRAAIGAGLWVREQVEVALSASARRRAQ